MTLRENQFDELRELIGAISEDRLTADQAARLEQLLGEDEAARWFYLEYIDLIGGLHWEGAAERESPSLPPVPAPGLPVDLLQRGMDFGSRTTPFSLIVAGLALGTLLTVLAFWAAPRYFRNHPQPDLQPAVTYVARLTRTVDCKWSDRRVPPMPGDFLHMGRMLDLEAGLAEITFDSGARAVLEGPAVLVIESVGGMRIESGKLVVNVPETATGFTVRTPAALLTDLGTEFGVEVGESGATRLCVFKGAVRVDTEEAPGKVVRAGQAVHVETALGIAVLAAPVEPERFARSRRALADNAGQGERFRGSYDGSYPPDNPPAGRDRWIVAREGSGRIVPNSDIGRESPGVASFLDKGGNRLQVFRPHSSEDWGSNPATVEYEFHARLKIGKKTKTQPDQSWAYQVFGFRDEGGEGRIVALGWYYDLKGGGPGLALIGFSAKPLVTVNREDHADGRFHEYRVRKYLDRGQIKIQVFVDGVARLSPPALYSNLQDDSERSVGKGFGLFSSNVAKPLLVVDYIEYRVKGGD